MVLKIIVTSSRRRRRSGGTTLMETVFAMGITGMILLVLVAISMLSQGTIVSFANYVDLNGANRIAMDTLTRDVRQSHRVTACTNNMLTLEDSDNGVITYSYSAVTRTLDRLKDGNARTLLRGCDLLTFNIAQRNPIGGSYDVYPSATPDTAKVISVAWNCSRTVLGQRVSSENVQSARIVIRQQRQ